MELSMRLRNKTNSKQRYNRSVRKSEIHAIFAKFWEIYGWEPFKVLIVRLHDDPNFPPRLDQNNFAYYMSLFTEEDVSNFFEKQGWIIDNETKEKIKKELQIRG
jgi:hypothetical protein